MSATGRPCNHRPGQDECYECAPLEAFDGRNTTTLNDRMTPEERRAVNGFAALLAVAEAADRKHLRLSDGTSLGFASRRRDDPIVQALEALDAAHPGWREWTP